MARRDSRMAAAVCCVREGKRGGGEGVGWRMSSRAEEGRRSTRTTLTFASELSNNRRGTKSSHRREQGRRELCVDHTPRQNKFLARAAQRRRPPLKLPHSGSSPQQILAHGVTTGRRCPSS